MEANILGLGGRVKRHGDVHEPEAQASLPHSFRHGVRVSRVRTRAIGDALGTLRSWIVICRVTVCGRLAVIGGVTVIRRVAVNAGSLVRLVCKVPLVVRHEMAEGDHQSRRLQVPLTIAFDDPDRVSETRRLTCRRQGALHAVRSRPTVRSRVRRRLGARLIIDTLLVERFERPGPLVRGRVRRRLVGVDAGRSGCDPPRRPTRSAQMKTPPI